MGEEEQSNGTKRCPYCAEEILVAARKCKHCGTMLDHQDFEPTEDYPLPPTQVNTGQTLNERYVISTRLARGGMAEIFLARDLELDMDVALKVVPPALADDPRLIKHLRDEAKIAIQLTHQNIVRIYSFDASGDVKFIVMEYVRGKNLYQLINETKEGKFSANQVIEWLEPACSALGYAHSLGVIHRDIKPSNIMVEESGIVKVADFGIARRLQDSMKSISQHTVRGTPNYMSPEQLRGEKVTVQSDIYALAATVYMLLSGNPPFVSPVIAVSSDRPTPKIVVGIPPRMYRTILKCLDLDPHERISSVEEFYETLKESFARPSSTKTTPVIPPPPKIPVEEPTGPGAEEVAIRVDAEELPEGLDGLSATLRDKAVKASDEGDFKKAAKLFEELATMVPKNPEAWNGMGDCLGRTGDHNGAIKAYRAAIKVEYDNIYARFQIGLAFEELDEFDKAIKSYEDAIKIIQDDPGLHLEVSLKKLKNQIQSVRWKVEQTHEARRKEVQQIRERQEQNRLQAEERRRRSMRIVIIIILVIMLLAIGLGAAEYFIGIFEHLPF